MTPEGRSLEVIRGDVRARFASHRLAWLEERSTAMHDLDTKLYDDVFRYSLPPLLRYADRNSMAFSIESRMPLLDYRLAEHVFALPLHLIMRDGWTKYVFRRAMTGRLPPEVQWRKDKMGFVTPEGLWLQQGHERIASVLSGELAASEFLDASVLQRRLGDYVRTTKPGAYYSDLFRWYVLELWMRHAFGSSALDAPAEDDATVGNVGEAMR